MIHHRLHPAGEHHQPRSFAHLPTLKTAERNVLDAARVWFDTQAGPMAPMRRDHAESRLATAIERLILVEERRDAIPR